MTESTPEPYTSPDVRQFVDGQTPDALAQLRTEPASGAFIAGRYKLLERIAEGGMGAVWVAEQFEPVKRKVALKLIKAGMDSKQVLARFDAERQALALMDHPNIAKVLDGGLTNEGRPFFVMELVHGVKITDFCDEHRLTPRQRLELFVPVCQAIQHAHQKGIIHRDIKPSNVLVGLVDERPVPKVIDFGVAKATAGALTEQSLETGVAALVGTPQYMSPEQATLNNIDIDTRSDVYSLGILLYELLTGTLPFSARQLEQKGLLEILRVVREEEAPRPSTKLSTTDALPIISANRNTEPKTLTGLLRNDLDWVVMKALEKDRSRRYETANSFAADIQRYLAGEAVHAHPPSKAYRLKKFTRRNKVQVIAASLVLLALIAGVIGTTLGLVQAENQRVKADQAREREAELADGERVAKETAEIAQAKAEKAYARTADVLDTMVSEVTGDSLATQKAITAEQKKFLTEVLTYYKEFAGGNADNENTRRRTAQAAYRVGLIQYRLGRMEESAAAFRRAHEGYAAVAAESPSVVAYRQDLAKSHNGLGILLVRLGKQLEAEEHYRNALSIRKELAAEFTADPEYRKDLATSHNNLGVLLADLGKREEAESQYRDALEIQEKLAADLPAVFAHREQLAATHNNLGVLLMGLGKHADAEKQYRRALNIMEKLAAEFPALPEYRQLLANIHSSLGFLLAGLNKRGDAEEHYGTGLAIREKLADDFPAVPVYLYDLAKSHNTLGLLLEDLGKRPQAEDRYRKALAILEKLVADFPAVPEYRQILARSHNNLGNLLSVLGNRPEAEVRYRKALEIREKLASEFPTVPEYRQELAMSHNDLGNLLLGIGKRPEAEDKYRKALAIREKLVAEFPSVPTYRVEIGGSYCNFGNLIVNGGKPSESLEWFAKAISLLTPVYERDPRDVMVRRFLRNSLTGQAVANDRLGKYADAVKDLDRVIELSENSELPMYRAYRANFKLRAGQLAEAVAEAAELTKSSSWNAGQWYNFARVYALASGKIADKKDEYAKRAVELLQRAVKAGYKDAAHVMKDADLDALRDREDFKKLMDELEAKPSKPLEMAPPPREKK